MPSSLSSSNLKRAGSEPYASDLQTVYRQIIHTSDNAVTPSLRSKTSAKQRPQTQPSTTSGKLSQTSLHYETEPSPLRASDSSYLSASTEEIVIKQLPFHVRERPVTSSTCTRTHSAKNSNKSTSDFSHVTALRKPDKLPPGHRLKHITDHWTSVYSEQSMRYVTEQVALEQARQRKRLAGLQAHRVDKKYLVNGSGFFSSPEYIARSNSAIISRVLYQNRYSRPYRPGYMCRPKPQIDLVVNGCGRRGYGKETDKDRSSTQMESNSAKSEAVNGEVGSSAAETSLVEISDGFKAAMSRAGVGVGGTAAKDQVSGDVSVDNEAKHEDKPVRSVTFILPNEDSLAV